MDRKHKRFCILQFFLSLYLINKRRNFEFVISIRHHTVASLTSLLTFSNFSLRKVRFLGILCVLQSFHSTIFIGLSSGVWKCWLPLKRNPQDGSVPESKYIAVISLANSRIFHNHWWPGTNMPSARRKLMSTIKSCLHERLLIL